MGDLEFSNKEERRRKRYMEKHGVGKRREEREHWPPTAPAAVSERTKMKPMTPKNALNHAISTLKKYFQEK